MHDAIEAMTDTYELHAVTRDEEHDQVGTVEVQILLSWFFETSTPGDMAIDLPRAA